MKIAFIYDAIYPFVTGGAEKRVYELAKRLVKRGHDVHWYGIGWWWPENGQKDMELDGIKLHGVCKPTYLYDGERRSIKEAIYFAVKLFPKLMHEKYDIVDCQGFPFFSCFTSKIHALLGRSTLIITLHEVWNNYWYEYLGKAGFFGKLIEKIMVYLSHNIITVSNRTKKDLKIIKSSEKSVVIPNGIDYQEIRNIKSHNEKSDVIYAGRLIKEKNIDLLIKTICIIKEKKPGVKCLIIGEGPEKIKLLKLVDGLGIENNVIFKDFLDNHDDLIKYMKSSRVFVLPSRREGFGIVVIEANASGLPVVVVESSMNAAVDLVQDGINGFIASPNVEDLALKVIKAMKQKQQMREKCLDFAMEYDWDQIVPILENYYHKTSDYMQK
jgi:glycosyltransferase involved in cell wall biosynthesis